MMKTSVYIAIFVGALLIIAETLINWGRWQWWPFFVVDYVAGALLLAGGVMWLRSTGSVQTTLLLAVAWAFTTGMSWMSFAANVEMAMASSEKAREVLVGGVNIYVVLVGLLFTVSALNLIAVMKSAILSGRK